MERIDQLIQDLINYLVEDRKVYVDEYIGQSNITPADWDIIKVVALENGIITELGGNRCYIITKKGFRLDGTKYIEEIKKERIEKEFLRQKAETREIKELEKLDTELTLAKWQKKVFWPVLIGGAIGGICGILSLWIQLTAG